MFFWYMYTVWNDYHNPTKEHTHHLLQLLYVYLYVYVCVVRTLAIYSQQILNIQDIIVY